MTWDDNTLPVWADHDGADHLFTNSETFGPWGSRVATFDAICGVYVRTSRLTEPRGKKCKICHDIDTKTKCDTCGKVVGHRELVQSHDQMEEPVEDHYVCPVCAHEEDMDV